MPHYFQPLIGQLSRRLTMAKYCPKVWPVLLYKPYGQVMELTWQPGKTTHIRLDQGVGFWQIDDKPPWFDDNTSKPEQQAEKMLSLIPKLKVRNSKDFPTQIFVKER